MIDLGLLSHNFHRLLQSGDDSGDDRGRDRGRSGSFCFHRLTSYLRTRLKLVQVLAAEVVPVDPRILDGAEQETSGVPKYTAPLHYFNIAMTIARLL